MVFIDRLGSDVLYILFVVISLFFSKFFKFVDEYLICNNCIDEVFSLFYVFIDF